MRQIILDTETTGLSYEQGHRVIEIGCVEMVNRRLTGEVFHVYLNPEREVDKGAFHVHGLDNVFLNDKPLFKAISEAFKAFIKGAELIIHNATFDVGFLQNEFKLLEDKAWENLSIHCTITDTLALARKKHPGQRNNLDALCKRYQINNQHREKHGALLDAEILADVYLAMTGGQSTLNLEVGSGSQSIGKENQNIINEIEHSFPVIMADEEAIKAHENFLKKLQEQYFVEPIWNEVSKT